MAEWCLFHLSVNYTAQVLSEIGPYELSLNGLSEIGPYELSLNGLSGMISHIRFAPPALQSFENI